MLNRGLSLDFGPLLPIRLDFVALFDMFGWLVGWLVLLLYVPSQQLWSLRDGQFT